MLYSEKLLTDIFEAFDKFIIYGFMLEKRAYTSTCYFGHPSSTECMAVSEAFILARFSSVLISIWCLLDFTLAMNESPNRNITTEKKTSVIPVILFGVRAYFSLSNNPKLSIIKLLDNCPAITTTKKRLIPNRGVRNIEAKM
eukprot:snap_masked-scaffold_3-processed-gene-18.36-mRNA-1 protein AED:1.00 eAED:1.00 QI:0/0/0/0/1/1/2/0/141